MALMLSPDAGLNFVPTDDYAASERSGADADEIAHLFDMTRDLDPETLSDALAMAYGERTAKGLAALRQEWLHASDVNSDGDLRSLIVNVTAWNDPSQPGLEDGARLNPETLEEVAAAAAFLQDTLQ